jgi:hypothetical protein
MAPFPAKLSVWRDPDCRPGRPTDYRPEYCALVIEYMAQGYSLTAFAGTIRQARDTMYAWIRAHREFSDAVNRGRAARVAWLETKLLTARRGGEVAASIFALKNADPVEWKEVRDVRHRHTLATETLSDAELYAIASGRTLGETTIEGEFTRESEEPATP